MLVSTLSKAEPIYVWEMNVHPKSVVATDCSNCDEQRSIWVECDRATKNVHISVPGASFEKGREGQNIIVTIHVDEWVSKRTAQLGYQGISGYFPELDLSLQDPLLEKMARGIMFKIYVNGILTEIPLTGSGKAIDGLRSSCR